MKKTSCATLLYGVFTGLLLFPLLGIKAFQVFVDGPDRPVFGFPLFWLRKGVTSLSWEADFAALAINLVFFIIIGVALQPLLKMYLWPKLLMAALAVAVAAYFAAFLAFSDIYAGKVFFDKDFRISDLRDVSFCAGFFALK